ncbi:Histidine utilization repressor [Desulfamplus magnetovallimortis]|uniref:Histidine utilization repressor n=1 Tax=Desulfamplus magnetovallimortis TaxID=1246637 RepID=A0A1W1HBJ4_9BACT|nr:histidine utilization repressor [Desulfamplus magnetovallimortis]SLM29813.1 Histidine utilization repressor [Desulfamplus magnetovallimortis]
MSLKAPKALYEQVKDHIMSRIQSGEWLPDSRIPSENQLVKELSVSRMTVNRALRELSNSGHLVRIQGVGTYVAQPKPLTALFEITSIDEEIRSRGGVHTCKVHLLQEEEANPELAAAMEIMPGTPVYHSIIVHQNCGKPVMLADRYVNPLSAPDYLKQDFTLITPSNYLLNVAPVTDVEHIVEAVVPDAMTRQLLNISSSEPCLVLHRQTWDDQRVVTHSRMTYPGSTYRIGGRFKPLSNGYNNKIK